MKINLNFTTWFNFLFKTNYRIISKDKIFLAQTRKGIFTNWKCIYTSDYKKELYHLSDSNSYHLLVDHPTIESARDTLKSRKLYDEIKKLKQEKESIVEYL